MKVLLLAHRRPYPLESGQHLRLFHLARELATRHELSLVTFASPPHPAPLGAIFRAIHALPIPAVPRAPRSLRRLTGAFSVAEVVAHVPAMQRLVADIVRRERPDVIWAGGWDMLVYTERLDGPPSVADVIDEGLLECTRELRQARRPLDALYGLKRLVNTVRWERRYFRHARRCVFVSAVDARWARRVVPGLAVSVVENGVDAECFRPGDGEDDAPSLVFEGNQGFPPNVDAAGYFVRAIWPSVLRSVPACRLYVVGRDPHPATRALAGERVVVTGRVDDVRPFLDRASVFVCPMRTGAGIKNKILQAWAMAKPVVATPAAVGGLRAIPGTNIVVASGATAFAEQVVRLLADPVARRDLGKHARETVLAHYTWQRQARALEDVLRSA